MKRPIRTRLISAGLIGLVFLGGALTGYAADTLLGDGTDPALEDEAEAWIIERVGLTSDQRVQVDSIVEHYRGEMTEVVEEYRERYRELVSATRSDIEEVLTPEQRREYRALLERGDGEIGGEETAEAPPDPER